MKTTYVGLGDSNASIWVYTQNRPPLPHYHALSHLQPLTSGDIANIAESTGNHWRKIFNVYAKLVFEVAPCKYKNWQQLRDQHLLQAGSGQCLLFSPYRNNATTTTQVHLIMGKGYAEKMALTGHGYWHTADFSVNSEQKMIICPYFDYRQLSNKKIVELASLIKMLLNKSLFE